MTDELKLKLIQQHIQTYYEAGGAKLPSAYKSAVLDMLDMIAHGEIETAEERIAKDELKRIEEAMQYSKYNSAVAGPDLKAFNDKMPTTNYAIETNAKENSQ